MNPDTLQNLKFSSQVLAALDTPRVIVVVRLEIRLGDQMPKPQN